MDLAILGTRIYTGDPRNPWAEALAVRGNRIALVGSTQEIRRACGARTQVLDLPGRLVTPGFVDAHLHFINLGRTLQWVNLRNLNSLVQCREEIRRNAATRPEGEWIIGRGWNHHQWAEKCEPTRADLDDLCSDQPVEDWSGIAIEATVVDGEIAYCRESGDDCRLLAGAAGRSGQRRDPLPTGSGPERPRRPANG